MPAQAELVEFTARHRYARTTARKARLVADLIRGQSVNRALELLSFPPKRASTYYTKLVRSAMASATQNDDVNVNRLVISDCRADDGPLLNNRLRFRPGPQGRAMPIRKRTSHLTVKLREEGEGGRRRRTRSERAAKQEQPTEAAPAPAPASESEVAAEKPARPASAKKPTPAKKPSPAKKKQRKSQEEPSS